MPVATGLGPVDISPATVARIVGHHLFDWPQAVSWTAAQDAIIAQVRIPRVLLGAVVDAGLAVTGTALQAMVRNVLADPYLLGVTAGASTEAAATILFGVGTALGASSLTGSAFIGAVGSVSALYVSCEKADNPARQASILHAGIRRFRRARMGYSCLPLASVCAGRYVGGFVRVDAHVSRACARRGQMRLQTFARTMVRPVPSGAGPARHLGDHRIELGPLLNSTSAAVVYSG